MPNKRRVLVLNHFAAPRGEAGGTRHVELFSRLPDWEYLIVASDLNPQTGGRVKSQPGLAVVHVPTYSSNGLRRILNWVAYAWRAFLMGMRQPRLDVVYGSSPHLLAAAAAWLIAAARRKPFVLEVRDLWPQVLVDMGTLSKSSALFRVLTWLEEFLYARARAIVVMAQGTQTELVRRGVPQEKLHYIPNGADPEDFRPSASREVLRRRYGFHNFTAIYAGAHGPANGLNLLLEAARQVRDLDVTVVLVGGGIHKRSLMETAIAGGTDNVVFLDPVPKTEVPDLLSAADVGIHVLADVPLFQSAVSPNKVFDYMAAGMPIITNVPGLVGSLVQASGAGLAVAPTELHYGLREMAQTDRKTLVAMGRQGLSWVASNQSRSAMSRALTTLLEDTVDASEK